MSLLPIPSMLALHVSLEVTFPSEADITQVTHIMWIHCAIIHVVVIHVVVIQVVVIHPEVGSVESHRQLNLWMWWGCIYSGSIYSLPSITFQSALFPMPELPINHIPRALVLDLNHLFLSLMWQQCWHSHPINHSRDWLYPIPRALWVDPTIRSACEMDTMSSILPETPFQVHCTLTPTIWSVFEVMTFLHHQSCSTHSICGAPHGCMMLILFIEWQEWTGCTKASSHQTGLSLMWDTARWRLTWCMLAPLCLFFFFFKFFF